MKTALDIQRVSKSYHGRDGTVAALTDVSLAVAPGELVAVQGPSGCGKTTLLLAAGGLLQPDGGRITVAEEDLAALSSEKRARLRAGHIGFVFQQFHLVPYLSVWENVLTPALAWPAPDVESRAHELLERFGLSARAPHVPADLSTGERQRTALARALLNRPGLILADEPTGNLDPENANTVIGCLQEFAQAGGAVLLVTHDATLAQQARRVLRLQFGKLV